VHDKYLTICTGSMLNYLHKCSVMKDIECYFSIMRMHSISKMLILMDNHNIQKWFEHIILSVSWFLFNEYHNKTPTFFMQVYNFAIFPFRYSKCLLWIYENDE
jgi:hypothetical protein